MTEQGTLLEWRGSSGIGWDAASGATTIRVCAKLFVFGLSEVGTTTLLRALFPEKADVTHKGTKKTLYLQGLCLTLQENQESIVLWQPSTRGADIATGRFTLLLQDERIVVDDDPVVFSDEQEAKRWYDMLSGILQTSAAETANMTIRTKAPLPHRTYGIDVRTHDVEGVAISAWNFAGQRASLGNYRHFVSIRGSRFGQSVYMVVYDASKRHEDIRTFLLDFLRTLKAHLFKADKLEEEERLCTIIYVMGTHLDAKGVSNGDLLRKRGDIIRECILISGIGYDWEHYEVSASTLEAVHFDHSKNILTTLARRTPCDVSDIIRNLSERLVAVSGVSVLMSKQHFAVLEAVKNCKKPMIRLKELHGMVYIKRVFFLLIRNLDLCSVHDSISAEDLRIALRQLNSWGRVIYIDGLDHVILEPIFFTQRVLGELYRPEHKAWFQNGEISVEDLKIIWSESCAGHEHLFDDMIAYLKGLHICFEKENMEDEENVEEEENDEDVENGDDMESDDDKESDGFDENGENMLVFPDFLDLLPQSDYESEEIWPEMSGGIDLELAYGFEMDILPQEMIAVLAAILSGKVSNLEPYKNVAVMHSRNHAQTHARIDAESVTVNNVDVHRLLIHVRGFKSEREHVVDLIILICVTVRRCLEGYPGIAYEEILQACSDDWLLRRDIESVQWKNMARLCGEMAETKDKGTLSCI